jgi:hypothetical protein
MMYVINLCIKSHAELLEFVKEPLVHRYIKSVKFIDDLNQSEVIYYM